MSNLSPAVAANNKLQQPQVRRISIPQERKDKFELVLLYILSKIGGEPNVGETVIYKILYFIDFDYYEKFQVQLIGAKYIKNLYGPTPVMFSQIIKKLVEEDKIDAIKSKYHRHRQKKYLINPQYELDLSALTGREINHIDSEINRFRGYTANQISDFSHLDTPWIVAEDKQLLEYEHVFYRDRATSVAEYDEL